MWVPVCLGPTEFAVVFGRFPPADSPVFWLYCNECAGTKLCRNRLVFCILSGRPGADAKQQKPPECSAASGACSILPLRATGQAPGRRDANWFYSPTTCVREEQKIPKNKGGNLYE